MNTHLKRLTWLLVLVFWAVLVGVFYSILASLDNFMAIGWIGKLMYTVLFVVVIYIGVYGTKHLLKVVK